MLRKSIRLSFTLCTLVAFAMCKRGEFHKFDVPQVLIFLSPAQSIEVFPDPKKAEKALGTILDSDNAQAIGRMDLAAASFLQIQCPARLKCEDGVGYIENSGIAFELAGVSPVTRVIGIELDRAVAGAAKKYRQTRDWFLRPSATLPMETEPDMLEALVLTIPDEDARTAKIAELKLLADALEHPEKLKDSRLDSLRRRYGIQQQKNEQTPKESEASDGKKNPESNSARESLVSGIRAVMRGLESRDKERYADSGMANVVVGFPFRSNNWPGLAREFQLLSHIPYAQETVLASALEGADYTIDPPLPDNVGTQSAEWKVEVRPLEGTFIKAKVKPERKLAEGDTRPAEEEDFLVRSVSAEPSKNGMAFVMQTSYGKVKVTPAVIPPYLARGGPGLETFVKNIPGDWQKIQRDNGFQRALMLTAMKFGHAVESPEGKKGRLEYEIRLSDSQYHYWMMFDLIKKSPNIVVEGQGFNGRFGDGVYAGNGTMAVESWYQPKGEFRIQFRTIMGRGGGTELSEFTCFTEGNGTFRVSVPPADINKEKPDARIELSPQADPYNLCADTILVLNAKKE
ncbi:MAG: hypothetical protein JNM27_07390 [Leptospirales bacterium]|nr:hypothetical protein [Leptospirales bacterium]